MITHVYGSMDCDTFTIPECKYINKFDLQMCFCSRCRALLRGDICLHPETARAGDRRAEVLGKNVDGLRRWCCVDLLQMRWRSADEAVLILQHASPVCSVPLRRSKIMTMMGHCRVGRGSIFVLTQSNPTTCDPTQSNPVRMSKTFTVIQPTIHMH